MWGLIDLNHGKERVFAAISDPLLFVKLYNDVADEQLEAHDAPRTTKLFGRPRKLPVVAKNGWATVCKIG